MNLNWKKIGLILLFLGTVALFAFFIYFFFFKPLFQPSQPIANINQQILNGQLTGLENANGRMILTNEGGQLPGGANISVGVPAQPSATAQGNLTKTTALTDTQTYFITSSAPGYLIYYDRNTGKFYRLDSDGAIASYSDKVFFDVRKVTWSNNRDKAVLEYPDGNKIIYDFKNNKQITLPKHWQEFSWSPTDQNLAFKSVGLNPENRFLAVARSDGSQAKTIEDIGDAGNKFTVNWSPNQQMIATFVEGKNLDSSEVYFIGLNKENFKLMTVEGRDFRGQWSPEGDKMLYSVYNTQNDYKPQLWIADAQANTIGDNRERLGLETWADKCAFADNNKLFCAVPNELPFGAGLDSTVANNIADRIYEINLQTGSKKLIAIPEGEHTVGSIILTNDSRYLFFTDKNDNKTYKINLK